MRALLVLLVFACGRSVPAEERTPRVTALRQDAGFTDAGPLPEWARVDFTTENVSSACSGPRFVRFHPGYQLWVGAILCTPRRYKLVLGQSRDGRYFAIGDTSGHGQDHCELVDPSFRLPNEDEIQSGGCTTCRDGPVTSLAGTDAFVRGRFGAPFTFRQRVEMAIFSTGWLECGVSIPD